MKLKVAVTIYVYVPLYFHGKSEYTHSHVSRTKENFVTKVGF